jgi:hypothetical protein
MQTGIKLIDNIGTNMKFHSIFKSIGRFGHKTYFFIPPSLSRKIFAIRHSFDDKNWFRNIFTIENFDKTITGPTLRVQ